MAPPKRSPTLQEAFGRALRARRESVGFTQEELAFASELDRTYISQLERGHKSPTLSTIARLAVALKAKASALVADGEELM